MDKRSGNLNSMSDVTAIIPSLPAERGTVTLQTGGQPKSRAEIMSAGQLPGAAARRTAGLDTAGAAPRWRREMPLNPHGCSPRPNLKKNQDVVFWMVQ